MSVFQARSLRQPETCGNGAYLCVSPVQCAAHVASSRQGRTVKLGCERHYPFAPGTSKGCGACVRCRDNFDAIKAFTWDEQRAQQVLGVEAKLDMMPTLRNFSAHDEDVIKVWDEPAAGDSMDTPSQQDPQAFAKVLPGAVTGAKEECGVFSMPDRHEICLLAAFELNRLYPSAFSVKLRVESDHV